MIRRAARGLRQLGLIPYRSSPLVFGLGVSKTGTTSLGAALKLLGYRHKSYDLDLLEHWSMGRLAAVDQARRSGRATIGPLGPEAPLGTEATAAAPAGLQLPQLLRKEI